MNCLNCNNETNNPKYCSKSCSVTYNNRIQPKRIKYLPNNCQKCNIPTKGKFCSQKCHGDYRFEQSLKDILQSGIIHPKGYFCTSYKAKKVLAHIHGYKCIICGISEWQNKTLVLITDHINGIPDDWRLDNLRLICPNCDSQTDTYKSKNKGHGRPYRKNKST